MRRSMLTASKTPMVTLKGYSTSKGFYVTIPTCAVGDLILIAMGVYSQGTPVPSGYTDVYSELLANGSYTTRHRVVWKIATSTDSGSSVQVQTSTSNYGVTHAMVFSGVSTTNPIAAFSHVTTVGDAWSATVPSLGTPPGASKIVYTASGMNGQGGTTAQSFMEGDADIVAIGGGSSYTSTPATSGYYGQEVFLKEALMSTAPPSLTINIGYAGPAVMFGIALRAA